MLEEVVKHIPKNKYDNVNVICYFIGRKVYKGLNLDKNYSLIFDIFVDVNVYIQFKFPLSKQTGLSIFCSRFSAVLYANQMVDDKVIPGRFEGQKALTSQPLLIINCTFFV